MESSICRVCLENNANMVNIFGATQRSGISIAQIISQWSGHPVEQEDPFPNTICTFCLADAENAYEMEEEVLHCEDEKITHHNVVPAREEGVENNADYKNPIEDQIPSQVKKDPLEDDAFWEEYCQISDSEFDLPQVLEDNAQRQNYWDKQDCVPSESPFKCTYCPMYFASKSEFQTHLQAHINDRPHMCDLCSKTFATKQVLKVHKRIHTGERPFNCHHCTMSFTTNSNLKRHLRAYTKKQQLNCPYCSLIFKKNGFLQRHLKSHHQKGQFVQIK
ncbi:zinc finger protein 177 [Drosophila gunungcola]|uniref:zinc finger protein 177 n=1 Tax=Drosophila gunungcola TaxID=103775 RepID=UPI0022E69B02|nr:zinc finger protein 177 [Drosophila gunungcola]